MQRCLDLAAKGLGGTYPNPLVGCVIVNNGKIIGEGFHIKSGEAHAEVNAIIAVKDKYLLDNSVLFVNLEPCSHFGKTPPCTDYIIQHKIKEVVVGCIDTYKKVSGSGIKKLEEAGCKVKTGIMEKECRELNIRFFTFHEKKRPYIILKWAQTSDGYISKYKKGSNIPQPAWIIHENNRPLIHKWRAEEQALMIGTNTADIDNPQLNVRDWHGSSPVKIILDNKLRLNHGLNIFKKPQPLIVFNSIKQLISGNIEYIKIDFSRNVPVQIMDVIYNKGIQSVIIEGGKVLLSSFINQGLWDEARIFTGKQTFGAGIVAPEVQGDIIYNEMINEDNLVFVRNFVALKTG
ncbi:MAG: bifunctional diaminohydroxyphosphoribosylaminopyrimidine deaminase/5-amino-6-(5-phosphoribosylamino)uracil reductase RibD [Bacteroidia bacterium]|nr:bifunctional diaminohydroxyphosphoribosylaminopyrimidine deaminase/5-amino-6-(5-phosphoribosylamino)uracil reductase RibD [Bacteroidia bacterium]